MHALQMDHHCLSRLAFKEALVIFLIATGCEEVVLEDE